MQANVFFKSRRYDIGIIVRQAIHGLPLVKHSTDIYKINAVVLIGPDSAKELFSEMRKNR